MNAANLRPAPLFAGQPVWLASASPPVAHQAAVRSQAGASLRLLYEKQAGLEPLAALLRAQLKENAGIDLILKAEESAAYQASLHIARDFDLALIELHQLDLRRYLLDFRTEAWNNLGHYSNPGFDRLLASDMVPLGKILSEQALHSTLNLLVNQDGAVYPLATYGLALAHKKTMTDWKYRTDGRLDFRVLPRQP